MLSARECAPARRAWLLLGLILGTAGPGCARSRPLRRPAAEPPLLGVVSRAGGYPNGLAQADPGRKPKAKAPADATGSPTAEAADRPAPEPEPIERTSGDRRAGPIEVTLLPPLPPALDPPARPARSRSRPKPTPPPTVESLLADAKARLAALTTYQVHLTRQERIGESLHPPEDVILSIRREPRSVRLEWADGPHKGREVLYTDGGSMHINNPHGLVPRLDLPPDSPLVTRSSRHPITEAGFDSLLAGVDEGLAARGSDRVQYTGMETPEGVDRPCHKLVRKALDGQTRVVYLDPQTRLPALVTLHAADGTLQESYRFSDLKPEPTELAAASAFDPDARWGAAPGFLSRLAGHPADGGGMHR